MESTIKHRCRMAGKSIKMNRTPSKWIAKDLVKFVDPVDGNNNVLVRGKLVVKVFDKDDDTVEYWKIQLVNEDERIVNLKNIKWLGRSPKKKKK